MIMIKMNDDMAIFSLEYSILLRIVTLNKKERKCQFIALTYI
jgi:hypothetical protein